MQACHSGGAGTHQLTFMYLVGGGGAAGGRLFPPNNTGTPGFSDLPTALQCLVCFKVQPFLEGHKNLELSPT